MDNKSGLEEKGRKKKIRNGHSRKDFSSSSVVITERGKKRLNACKGVFEQRFGSSLKIMPIQHKSL